MAGLSQMKFTAEINHTGKTTKSQVELGGRGGNSHRYAKNHQSKQTLLYPCLQYGHQHVCFQLWYDRMFSCQGTVEY